MAPKEKAPEKPDSKAASKATVASASKAPSKATVASASKAQSKGKGTPGEKAAPAAKGAAEGTAMIDPKLVAKHKKIFITCGVISVLSIAVIVVMVLNYWKLKERRRPIDEPFFQLRTSLAAAINEPGFMLNRPKDVADELQLVPSKIEKASKLYNDKKKRYTTLFLKSARSSSGSWQFHGKSRYYFSKGEKNWYDAENFCISRGAHLASILDNEEQDFLSSQLQHTSWIGLTAANEDGQWRWSDGSRLGKEYWSEDYPRNTRAFRKSNQDCAMVVPSLSYRNWKDNNCHKLYRWICKENLDLGEQ